LPYQLSMSQQAISITESERIMKKSLTVLILVTSLTLILYGCQTKKNSNVSDYEDDFSKTQEITVISSDTSEVTETISDKKDIEDFILALDLDQWELKALPDELSEIGSFGLSQEETIKLGQTDTDGTLYDIATIVLYDNAYISFETGGLDMTFEVSESTADYLQGYFE